MIAFIDIEASSLSAYSYPIEVAWVLESGESECYLIQPMPTWIDWAADSALVHGIARADLIENGTPAPDVARRLQAVLDGCLVHSDAPAADMVWLNVLMRTAGLTVLRLLHIYDSYRSIFQPMVARLPISLASSIAKSVVMRAENEGERTLGVRHRAEPDARRQFDTWQRVKVLAAEATDGWPP